MTEPDRPHKFGGYVHARKLFMLSQACSVVRDAFGHCPYHVGSSLYRPDFHDVDVRTILPDDEYDVLFPGLAYGVRDKVHARWSLDLLVGVRVAVAGVRARSRLANPADDRRQRTVPGWRTASAGAVPEPGDREAPQGVAVTKVNINGAYHQVEIDHDGDLAEVVKVARALWRSTLPKPAARAGTQPMCCTIYEPSPRDAGCPRAPPGQRAHSPVRRITMSPDQSTVPVCTGNSRRTTRSPATTCTTPSTTTNSGTSSGRLLTQLDAMALPDRAHRAAKMLLVQETWRWWDGVAGERHHLVPGLHRADRHRSDRLRRYDEGPDEQPLGLAVRGRLPRLAGRVRPRGRDE